MSKRTKNKKWNDLQTYKGQKLLKVLIEVSGGVAYVTQCPNGVKVDIVDHDNDKR